MRINLPIQDKPLMVGGEAYVHTLTFIHKIVGASKVHYCSHRRGTCSYLDVMSTTTDIMGFQWPRPASRADRLLIIDGL